MLVPLVPTAKPRIRGRGVTVGLLKAAAVHARRAGARLLEGYPVVKRPGAKQADAFLWWGVSSAFEKAGFRAAAKPSAARAIMRKELR